MLQQRSGDLRAELARAHDQCVFGHPPAPAACAQCGVAGDACRHEQTGRHGTEPQQPARRLGPGRKGHDGQGGAPSQARDLAGDAQADTQPVLSAGG